jgi:hypothetical protein
MREELVPYDAIEKRIYLIRGQKVMLDRDLAELYGAETAALNQAVKRNKERFPEDFMFSLTQQEKINISQIVICSKKPYETIKHAKNVNAFTEYGILMLSSALNSSRAVQVNIQIMRIFTQMRKAITINKELFQKFELLEKRVFKHDSDIRQLVRDIRKLTIEKSSKRLNVGFLK